MNGSINRLGTFKIPKVVDALDFIKTFRYLIPVLILVIASILRLYGIEWDKGGMFHPDERAILFHLDSLSLPHWTDLKILLDARYSPLNPHWFPYGSLTIYLVKLFAGIISVFTSVDLTGLSLIGRALSASADIGTVFMTFMIGSVAYNRKVGYLSSLLVSLSVIHIQLSHFFVVDTYLTFFVTTSLYFIIKIAKRGGAKNSIYAGVFVGLAIATKISVIPIFGALFAAYFFFYIDSIYNIDSQGRAIQNNKSVIVKWFVLSLIASFLVFFITTPYAFLDWYKTEACVMPFEFLEFLSNNEYACAVGGEIQMARGESARPYTQQYIGTTPFIYQIRQLTMFGLGPVLGLLAWLSLGFMLFWAVYRKQRPDIILVTWVLSYFILTGYLEVKFLRYMLPITPIMLIFVSHMLYMLSGWSLVNNIRLYFVTQIVTVILILATMLNALAFMNIYSNDHTAFKASDWINQNVSTGSVILMEHWEEGLPNLDGYIAGCRGNDNDDMSCMRMYDSDQTMYSNGKPKIGLVVEQLANADYLVFFSNRLYGTIPRLESKYPYTSVYYRKLFSGKLGYDLEHYEDSYPSLFGFTFINDTFARPNLYPPDLITNNNNSTLSINMGYADESFDAYDHPLILIFKNNGELSQSEIMDIILESNIDSYKHAELMMSFEIEKIQQQGGSWQDIVYLAHLPIYILLLEWYLLFILIGFVTFPIAFCVFRFLPDKGYAFSKLLGLLFVSYISWLLTSYQLLTFSRFTIIVSLLVVCICSILVICCLKNEIAKFLKRNTKHIIITEVVFTLSFLLLIIIRSYNPDLWHPYIGGEKSMDMSYINAILKSTYMPPYDPWFSGGYMNYYYFGYFVVATLIKITGTLPEIAYNISIAVFFSVTTSSIFSLVYNLTKGSEVLVGRSVKKMNPIVAGLVGVFIIAIMGNIDGLIQLIQAFGGLFTGNSDIEIFDFWRSSRMIPPGNPIGYAITEFPFFTFLFGDLHSHLISIPFAVLILALALNHMQSSRYVLGIIGSVMNLALLGLFLGILMMTNTWDYPTYLSIVGLSIIAGTLLAKRSVNSTRVVINILVAFSFVVFMSVVFCLPYIANYKSYSNGLSFSLWQTPIYSYIGIHSLFLFVILTYFIINLKINIFSTNMRIADYICNYVPVDLKTKSIMVFSLFFALCMTLVFYGYATTLFLMFLILIVLTILRQKFRQPSKHYEIFILILILIGFATGLGVELITVQGDITRMNTVFKFYLQAWLLLGVATSYLIWYLSPGFIPNYGYKTFAIYKFGYLWKSIFVILVLAGAIYPIFGTYDRIGFRFNSLPNTLNGLNYMKAASYIFDDNRGVENLKEDYEAVIWIRNNIKGSPVILEGQGELYRTLHGRVSIYTGLPTVLGWDNHQSQQRGYTELIAERKRDIETIYSSSNLDAVMLLIDKYDIRYVYIGQLEKYYYNAEGLEKFDDRNGNYFDLSYYNDEVRIYKVKHIEQNVLQD